MPRIRTIKPDFWDSPDTAAASLRTRLLYIAMWNWADDYGIGDATAVRLIGFAFPNDEIPVADYPRILAEVSEAFGVVFFEHRGRPFYGIPEWEKHQRTEKRSKADEALISAAKNAISTRQSENADSPRNSAEVPRNSSEVPNCSVGDSSLAAATHARDEPRSKTDENVTNAAESAVSAGQSENADSPRNSAELPALEVGSRKREEGSSTQHPLPSSQRASNTGTRSRGTHLPEDWEPSDAVKDSLRAEHPQLKLGLVLEEFRDYWLAIPGQRGRKLDWDRTFRNRVREVAHMPRFHRNGQQLTGADKKATDWLILGRQPQPAKELLC